MWFIWKLVLVAAEKASLPTLSCGVPQMLTLRDGCQSVVGTLSPLMFPAWWASQAHFFWKRFHRHCYKALHWSWKVENMSHVERNIHWGFWWSWFLDEGLSSYGWKLWTCSWGLDYSTYTSWILLYYTQYLVLILSQYHTISVMYLCSVTICWWGGRWYWPQPHSPFRPISWSLAQTKSHRTQPWLSLRGANTLYNVVQSLHHAPLQIAQIYYSQANIDRVAASSNSTISRRKS